MMSLGKGDVPEVEVPAVKNLNLLGVMDAVAYQTLQDVSDSYYEGDTSLNEDEAIAALQRIKGRMQVLRIVVSNIK